MKGGRSYKRKKLKTLLLHIGGTLYLFEIKGLRFKTVLKTGALHGKNGFTAFKKEGDLKTPVGIFKTGVAMGMIKDFSAAMPYFYITDDLIWVDDTDSRFYNKPLFKDSADRDFDSFEHLCRYRFEYRLLLEIITNPKCKKGKGSAVFLHCTGEKPYTAGCLAVSTASVEKILKSIRFCTRIIILP